MELEELSEAPATAEPTIPYPEPADPAPAWVDAYEM